MKFSDVKEIESFYDAKKKKSSVIITVLIRWFLWLIVTITLICLILKLKAQNYDILIKNQVYQSYFSNSLHVPVVVEYKLYHAGGNCSRAGYSFKNDKKNLITASKKDYLHSGYDEGHLCPAADFAFNCTYDEMTFRFYNCVPQTPNLNRDIWLSYEKVERAISQSDSILVVNICTFSNRTIGSNIAVPDYCIKFIFSLSSHKNLLSVVCKNSPMASSQRLPVNQIEKNYKINLSSFLPFQISQ